MEVQGGNNKVVVIASFNLSAIVLMNLFLIVFSIYILYIIYNDVVVHGLALSLQYHFYVIGFLLALPLAIVAMIRFDRIVFVERKPLLFMRGRYLIYGVNERFCQDISNVVVDRRRIGMFVRVSISVAGGESIIMPLILSVGQREIVREVERFKAMYRN